MSRWRFTDRVRALGPDLVFAKEAEPAALPDLDATLVIKPGRRSDAVEGWVSAGPYPRTLAEHWARPK